MFTKRQKDNWRKMYGECKSLEEVAYRAKKPRRVSCRVKKTNIQKLWDYLCKMEIVKVWSRDSYKHVSRR